MLKYITLIYCCFKTSREQVIKKDMYKNKAIFGGLARVGFNF